jgi:hypothetical protein
MNKPEFTWSTEYGGYSRCILEDMNIMLTVQNDGFGFYMATVWVCGKKILEQRTHPAERAMAICESKALEIYIQETK